MILALGIALQLAAAEPRSPIRPVDRVPDATVRSPRMVVVDAGHGGVDRGMSGPVVHSTKLYEKNVTLAVAQKLARELERRGIGVVQTRKSDTLIALSDRGRIANRVKGDLFISIHVNAAPTTWRNPTGARGFETYFLSDAKTEDSRRLADMENASLGYEEELPGEKGDALSLIMTDMMQNAYLRESSDLAEIIQHSLGRTHPGPSRGVKQAGFRVLVTAYMPAVLVELGFGSNPEEAAFLMDPTQQQTLAVAIADAAVEYLNRYARRISGQSP